MQLYEKTHFNSLAIIIIFIALPIIFYFSSKIVTRNIRLTKYTSEVLNDVDSLQTKIIKNQQQITTNQGHINFTTKTGIKDLWDVFTIRGKIVYKNRSDISDLKYKLHKIIKNLKERNKNKCNKK